METIEAFIQLCESAGVADSQNVFFGVDVIGTEIKVELPFRELKEFATKGRIY